ncbi:MAG: TonB-dependent receptor [Nitrospirae bacterium]|nr:MAG: TonB-dependent receptor [Nitrospirota bacterium]
MRLGYCAFLQRVKPSDTDNLLAPASIGMGETCMPLFIGVFLFVSICEIATGRWAAALEQTNESRLGPFVWGTVRNSQGQEVVDATVVLRDSEGQPVDTTLTNENGEFVFSVPKPGVYAVQAKGNGTQSPYVVVEIGETTPRPLTLILGKGEEIVVEVVSPVPPIRQRTSSEVYTLNPRQVQGLPRGNNVKLHELLETIPSAVYGSLNQVHIRQDHDNLQLWVDGVPIPQTVSSTFTDILPPRAWERVEVNLGGLEARYGNKTAAVVEVTTKRGRTPHFGSVQLFGGANETANFSAEYGGAIDHRLRFYGLNSYTTTNRGIDPPTLERTSFHNHSQQNQTVMRMDVQLDDRNIVKWLFLNSVATFQIPTRPGLSPNAALVRLIQSQHPTFSPVASQDIDENQEETNQYTHFVWRHNWHVERFLSLAAYFRHSRATFTTDPLNVLAFTGDLMEPFSAGSQDRYAYSGGLRFDYTHRIAQGHLLRMGFQIDRTQTVNKTRVFAFQRNALGNPIGPVISLNADNRTIGWREELWVQDQWSPTKALTLNLGLRVDYIQALTDDAQVSPRLGVSYALTPNHVFHAFYGRLFTPPNLEAVRFAQLNTVGTTAEPENLTQNPVEPERAHYVQIGSSHALGNVAKVQLTAYYKASRNLSDAGQFGTTPLLNFFAFEHGLQYGWDAAVQLNLDNRLTARANVAWGRCRGKGLQSGHFLLEQKEIEDIQTGVFCDHMQLVTSSATIRYRLFPHTTVTGQMLFGSGLRTAAPGAKTNSSHVPSHTVYNFSVEHTVEIGKHQKFLFGFDMINAFDQRYFINQGKGSIGLGVSHAAIPRSFFFRGQWIFDLSLSR